MYFWQILQSYLQDMFNSDVISSNKKPLGSIHLPQSGAGFKEFSEIVNQLSDDDKPAMFGLPANIQQVRSGFWIVTPNFPYGVFFRPTNALAVKESFNN